MNVEYEKINQGYISKKTIGVFTESRYVAKDKIESLIEALTISHRQWNNTDIGIEVNLYNQEPYNGFRKINEVRILWLKPNELYTGLRLNEAYIDEHISNLEIERFVFLVCGYCKQEDIHYF